MLLVESVITKRFFCLSYLMPFSLSIVAIFQDLMLFCDACDKGYHMQCHDPAVEVKPQGMRYACNNNRLKNNSLNLKLRFPIQNSSEAT